MRLPRAILATALTASIVMPAAHASAEPSTDLRHLTLKHAGAAALTLDGSRPVTRFDIAAPHRWSQADLDLTLRWTASGTIPDGTAVVVKLDGEPAGAANAVPGPGSLAVAAQGLTLEDNRIHVEIGLSFGETASRVRPRGAFVRFDATSPLFLTGHSAGTPRLSDLPGILVERAGDVVPPLVIVLPKDPSAEAIEAAGVVASAVSIHTGFPGQPLRVLTQPSDEELSAIVGAVVRIEEDGSPGMVRVRSRSRGETELVVRGVGRRLVDAAWSAAYADGLSGIEQMLPEGRGRHPGAPVARRSFPIGPASFEGAGPVRMELGYRMPTDRVVESARLHLELGFDVPGGGRLSIRANGRAIAARSLSSTGNQRLQLDLDLKRSDVDSGDNEIALTLSTNRPDTTALIDVLKGSAVGVRSRARVEPALEYFPFLTAGDPLWKNTIVSLPAGSSDEEIGAMLSTMSEASRWMGRPLEAVVAFDADLGTAQSSNLVSLVRSAPSGGVRSGTLSITRHGMRTSLVAVDARALTPLMHGYFAGRVHGSSAVVGERGRARMLARSPAEPGAARRWWVPLGAVVALLGLAFVAGLRRSHRRVAIPVEEGPWTTRLPAPESDAWATPAAVLDPEAALADWVRSTQALRSEDNPR